MLTFRSVSPLLDILDQCWGTHAGMGNNLKSFLEPEHVGHKQRSHSHMLFLVKLSPILEPDFSQSNPSCKSQVKPWSETESEMQ